MSPELVFNTGNLTEILSTLFLKPLQTLEFWAATKWATSRGQARKAIYWTINFFDVAHNSRCLQQMTISKRVGVYDDQI